ncbi:MAG: lipoate--protein ligase [Ruminococcaceae bacterium]|nr:lipoate--protein ligase [Oscillospiraceae bacterium]
MLIVRNNSTDPYYNLALEEWLMDNVNDDVFMLWRNEKTVVIGKNQNAYAEINREYADSHNITVSRRMTGGGAVFHDLGNVNFTFIAKKEEGSDIDFARFTMPVIDLLKKLGANAELSGRNDILIDKKKVSGNAQCVRNGKVLHHGCMLYSADLSDVASVLNVDLSKFQGKGIKSVRSRVANIKELCDIEMDVTDFIDYIEKGIEGEAVELSEEQIKEVKALRNSKYATWEWIWGRNKEYSLKTKKRFDYGTVELSLDTQGGLIKDVKIRGDFFGVGDITELESSLAELRYEHVCIFERLKQIGIERYIFGSNAKEIADLFFENSLL